MFSSVSFVGRKEGQERPSETDDSQATGRAAWDAANQGLFSILFFSTGGSAFFIVRRFEGTSLEDGAGDGQQAWAGLRKKFKGRSREATRAEHSKNEQQANAFRPGPGREFYIMDSCRDRLNACDPPDGPTDRQYDNVLLQVYRPNIRQFDKST